MKILFFDFESYYDSDFSLRKMAPPNYILDPRFEAIGCSFKEGDAPARYVDAPDIPAYLAQFDPRQTATVAFNALFDNCILAWRYGFVPARMFCTMRMAVSLRGHIMRGHSLAAVGELLKCGTKGTTIADAKGKHRADIVSDAVFYRAYQEYANNDNEMNAAIYHALMPEFPKSEYKVMDHVLRCAVEPAFICDTRLLEDHLSDLWTERLAMLDEAAGCPLTDDGREKFKRSLRSTTQFEATLKRLGVDIEYKTSPTNPELSIPAFSKTDEFMVNLQEHPDPTVQLLAAARLDLRSTIEQTRGERMLSMAQLPWEFYGGGYGYEYKHHHPHTMPIPLKYAAAHTHRLGGDWKLNFQNLPSGRGKQKSKLRASLCAPAGYKVVVADKAQIECRINAWLCGQQDLLETFATGGDPYSRLASQIFGFEVNKNVHKIERFIGKSGELGLGYGCGHNKFYNMVIRSARGMGMDMQALLKVWTPELAEISVRTYRSTHSMIVQTWRELDTILRTAWIGQTLPVRFGPCVIGRGFVEGPGGLRMQYANPREEWNEEVCKRELWYDYGGESHKIYGAKFLENIVQFLARIDTMEAAMRISARGYRFNSQAHDELIWVVPDDKVEDCMRVALEEMRRPPTWGPDIPLNAECSFGQSYGDAK
jgi:hypothetical protein